MIDFALTTLVLLEEIASGGALVAFVATHWF
jgi:hypothetical protein